jgi:hypothetical protein
MCVTIAFPMTTDDRPGLASRRLPGAVQELIATGDLPPDMPALVALTDALPHEWFACEVVGRRLDQKGWPLRNEVELACRVCQRDPLLTGRDRALLRLVRGWLARPKDEDALSACWRDVVAVQHGSALSDPSVPDEDCLRVFALICPDATEADRATFLAARRQPIAPSIAPLVVQCAYEARSGWLSYHLHRGLASPSALHAADLIRRVVRAGGITWREVVDLARELLPDGRCECDDPRAGAEVFVLSDAAASEWAYDLELSLDVPGLAPKGRELARFPIGDGLPALLGRLSHMHDVVVVVIGALGGNHTWMIKESAIRNLYPNVILALAPGVPLPEGWTSSDDWIVPAPADGELPHDALISRIQRAIAADEPTRW